MPGRRVLDVGAGVGKLCLVGAASTESTWFGIEEDAEMVRIARAAATRMHLEHRTCFLHGDISTVDWSAFDAFYLFNPFAELLMAGREGAYGRRERYIASIEHVQRRLAAADLGTRVVTYHGFGGRMPPGFDRIHRERAREDELCLWIRRAKRRLVLT